VNVTIHGPSKFQPDYLLFSKESSQYSAVLMNSPAVF
jgi:hypothetical protein